MRNTSFRKSASRSVKSALTRFLSLVLISFLGAGVLAGLLAVAPNMERVGDAYYSQYNVMDIQMLSTYGFSDEDVEEISNVDGVSGVLASYSVDAIGQSEDKSYAFRVNGLSTSDDASASDYINRLKMLDGRWPEHEHEAIIIRPSIGLKNITMNSVILLDSGSNATLTDTLGQLTYTIVGIAESPYYLSFMQGNTSVGGGMIDYVLYIPQQNFVVDGYTDLYVTVEGAGEFAAFEDAYFEHTEPMVKRLEDLAAKRQTLRHDGFQSELTEAKQEYAAAEEKLANAKVELEDGEKELESAKKEYTDGLAEYEKQQAEAKRQLAQGEAKLVDAATQIADGEHELAPKKKEFLEAEAALKAARDELDAAWLPAASQLMKSKEAEYAEKSAELEVARKQITAAEQELAAAKQAYEQGMKEYNAQKTEAETMLAAAKKELDSAAQEIAAGEKELSDGRKTYEEKKLEASPDLDDARIEITAAQAQLSALGEPKWYVLDRTMNEAYVSYRDDIARMRSLSTIFPMVFFLVAALVCLTTMTRMVDEDRALIGTFKALGYSNKKIAGRYLIFAAAASLIGSIAGICTGFYLIPTLVWNAYGIVFALPELTPAFYPGIGFFAVFTMGFVTTLFTAIAATTSMRELPSNLMRPKAPKSGKRVLLEYIKPVWSRLSFIHKVTIRNLGLNKKRLLMSLAGILGCTALVVSALGAKTAVQTILGGQFGEVFHYNLTVGFHDETPSAELTEALENERFFNNTAQVFSGTAETGKEGDETDSSIIYVVSPLETEGFAEFVTLRDTETQEEFSLAENSVIITEKLSMNLNVKIGDAIWVKYLDKEERHPVKITGITKNYVFNYIYLGKSAYETAFHAPPEYNQFLVITADGQSTDAITSHLTGLSGIAAVSFTEELMGNIKTTISSIDSIIWILIIAAGLLAFVVLYNLTNINIGERQRELATLKVLGFYNKETYSYIFRETMILSIVGCLAGLVFGIFLYRALVMTVEPDILLLTRDLTWKGYLAAAALTMFFTWIVNQCMKPKIKGIDMLESLKSVE